mmetsp:Transcript_1750/g.5777  ORF Transcript_1750/g.5777 Transcript_1750/m.5777 type:complete len:277 (+) Transcript_1750:277-1107(+)
MVKRVLPPPKVEMHAERPLLRRREAAHEPEPVGAAHADVAHHQLRESGKDIQQDVGGERADKLIQHWLQDALRHTRVIPTNQRRAISAGAAGRCSAESRAHHSDPLRPAGELVDLVTAEGRSAKNGWVVRGPVESERLPVGGPTGGEHVHVELQLGLALPAREAALVVREDPLPRLTRARLVLVPPALALEVSPSHVHARQRPARRAARRAYTGGALDLSRDVGRDPSHRFDGSQQAGDGACVEESEAFHLRSERGWNQPVWWRPGERLRVEGTEE